MAHRKCGGRGCAAGTHPRSGVTLVAMVVALVASLLCVASCRKKATVTSANLNVANKVSLRQIRLFYESPQMLLASEVRSVPLPESQAAAIPVVVRELLKGPARPPLGRLLPEDVVIRGAYLLPGGTAIVDLGGPTLVNGWGTGSHQELLAVYSVVETLTANFADVRRVRLLVNGTPAETLGGHVSLARSHAPIPVLVEPSSR